MEAPGRALVLTAASSLFMAALTVGLFFAGVFIVRTFGRNAGYSLSALGFARPEETGFVGGMGLGFLVGIGAVFVGGFLSAATAFVLSRFGYSAESNIQQPFMDSLRSWVSESPVVAVPTIILVVVVVGPACEEIAFRGGIFNALSRLGFLLTGLLSRNNPQKKPGTRFPVVLAAVLSSVFFALLHLEPVILPTLLVFALALCYLFQRTQSLVPSFVAHATFNSFATSVIILSGLGLTPTTVPT